MSDYSKQRFLWNDVETTGLVKKGGAILESAVVFTDRNYDDLFVVEDVFHFTRVDDLHPVAREMHEKTGLLERCRDSRKHPNDHIREVRLLLENTPFLPDEPKPLLSGSSIHYDRGWWEYHHPDFLNLCHYRNCDMSSLIEFVRITGGPEYNPPKAHTSLLDIRRSIAQAKFWRGAVRWDPTVQPVTGG